MRLPTFVSFPVFYMRLYTEVLHHYGWLGVETQTNQYKQVHFSYYFQQLKGIRHPAVLHYIGFEEGGEGPVLITEQVAPLQSVLGCLSAVEICSGLHAVLEALSFLHEKVG